MLVANRLGDNNPLISVVVPNYNKDAFIVSAVESVLSQRFRDFELIIVDDFSTDESIERIKDMCGRDSRVRLIRQSKHLGVSSARNKGIREARGKYISLLDSDDVYSSQWLEIGARVLEPRGDLSIAYADWWVMDADGRRIRNSRSHTKKSGFIFADLLLNSLEVNTAIMAPRVCFFESGLYDESISWGEDYDMILKLAKKYPFTYLGEEAYGYRLHKGNSWRQFPKTMMFKFKASTIARHLELGRSLLTEEEKTVVNQKLLRYYQLSGQGWKQLKLLLREGRTHKPPPKLDASSRPF